MATANNHNIVAKYNLIRQHFESVYLKSNSLYRIEYNINLTLGNYRTGSAGLINANGLKTHGVAIRCDVKLYNDDKIMASIYFYWLPRKLLYNIARIDNHSKNRNNKISNLAIFLLIYSLPILHEKIMFKIDELAKLNLTFSSVYKQIAFNYDIPVLLHAEKYGGLIEYYKKCGFSQIGDSRVMKATYNDLISAFKLQSGGNKTHKVLRISKHKSIKKIHNGYSSSLRSSA